MIKLNVGCGSKPKEGYINIDIVTKAADINADAVDLPFEQKSIDVIESYHLIEHMSRQKAILALNHWYSLLIPGGLLVIECPDIKEVMKKYLLGNEDMLFSVYGRNRYEYDTHPWGYSKDSIKTLLISIGFNTITVSNGTDDHSKFEPCMRIEAIK